MGHSVISQKKNSALLVRNLIRVSNFFRIPHKYFEVFEIGKFAQTELTYNFTNPDKKRIKKV